MHGSEHAQMGIGCHVCWIDHGTRILIAYSLIGISMAENQSDHDGDCSAKYSVDELKSFLLHKGIPSSIVEIFSGNCMHCTNSRMNVWQILFPLIIYFIYYVLTNVIIIQILIYFRQPY